MLNKELFRESFGTWWSKMEPLFDGGIMENIFKHLKSRSREGYKILPESPLLFRCFEECPLDELKVVIIGMAPYHNIRGNTPAADGLLMSCSNTGILQPSLEKWYKAIEKEYHNGLNLKMYENPDLKYLANQGVLLYNISLTTEIGKAAAHIDIWKPFTIYLLEEVISLTGVPVIFLGNDAAKYKRHLAPLQWRFILSHPASAAYNNTQWDSQGVFKKIDKILKDNNNEEIHWIEEK